MKLQNPTYPCLEVRLAQVSRALGELRQIDSEADECQGDFCDRAEAISRHQERARRLAMLEAQYQAISKAMKRIKEGTYGKCARCSRPIGEERLEADLTIELCIDCQKQQGSRSHRYAYAYA